MERYVYRRLQQSKNGLGEIRLVRIKPGPAGRDVNVSIEVHSLQNLIDSKVSGRKRIIWHALSYTWGSLEDIDNILVLAQDGSGDASYLPVTKNLTEALQYLRHPDEDRLMWIDAISIDQGTEEAALKERAAQVRNMHHIYSQAYGVIAWLGHEANDSSYALHLLSQLGASVKVHWHTFQVETPNGEPTEPMKLWYPAQPESRHHKAVLQLLQRPWFERLWVRQEALLANEGTSLIVAGKTLLSLATFRKAIHCLSTMDYDFWVSGKGKIKSYLYQAMAVCERTYSDEPNVMYRARVTECRDPRDKVYGNLGILSLLNGSTLPDMIEVDYTEANTTE